MHIIIGSISLVLVIAVIISLIVGEVKYHKVKDADERKKLGKELDNRITVVGIMGIIIGIILFSGVI